MTNISIQCLQCGAELNYDGKPVFCGCPNAASIRRDVITAMDLDLVRYISKKEQGLGFTRQDLEFQEERRHRKVRKLKFEER
jgi:hypothetical protein